MVDPYKVGSFLFMLRNKKHMTQAEVADALQLSVKTISKWECGNGLPSVDYLPQLAEFYGVSVDEILRGEYKTQEEKEKSEKSENIENKSNFLPILFSVLSISFSFLSLFLSLIVGIISTNGLAFILILFLASLLSGVCLILAKNSQGDISPTLNLAMSCLFFSSVTFFCEALCYVYIYRSNVMIMNGLLFCLFLSSFLPYLIMFFLAWKKRWDFRTLLEWKRFVPLNICLIYLFGICYSLFCYHGHDDNAVYWLVAGAIGSVSSLVAIIFSKYAVFHDFVILLLFPLSLILFLCLNQGQVYDLDFMAFYGLSDIYALMDIIRFFAKKKKVRRQTE